MEDFVLRVVENLLDRVTGPMHFRLLIQPLMAVFFAVMSGLNDAKEGKPPYFWSLLSDPEHRREMVKDGWKSVGRIFVLAIVLDVIYQFIEQGFVYPGETVLVAFILAILPYLLLRGLVTRLARTLHRGTADPRG